MKHSFLFTAGLLFAALIIFIPSQSRSSAQAPTSKYKNIKVLNSLSDNDVAREMQAWNRALGERCTFCHEGNDYVSDANPKKEIARKMATMVMGLNKEFLGGKATCMLCHRGSAVPDPNAAPPPESK